MNQTASRSVPYVEPELSLETLVDLPGASLVLCATARQASDLRRCHGELMRARGQTHWAALPVFPLDDWLQRWREDRLLRGLPPDHAFALLPLDTAQERLLWERVIRDDLGEQIEWLFDIAALARSAQEAHALMEGWSLTVPDELQGHEAQRFLVWREKFLAECQRSQWIDGARLRSITLADVAQGTAQLPRQWVLAGFLSLDPREQAWIDGARAQGVRVHRLALHEAATPRVEQLPDAPAERLAAALWVREKLAENPTARLALVVPDLSSSRDQLQDALDEVLLPAAFNPIHAEAPRPYNLSLGQPLARYPVVASALRVLGLVWERGGVAQSQWSALLRDPLWSDHAGEGVARAHFEAWLRQRRSAQLSLRGLRKALDDFQAQSQRRLPTLSHHLAAMDAASDRPRGLPSAWAQQLTALLESLGCWAGRSFSSHEYQTRQALSQLIDRLGTLDAFTGPLDGPALLRQLGRLCRERIFQPRTEGEPSVQVLGLLEASGQRFDAVRVIGLSDAVWPPPARPNPLLPASLQREARTPNASAAVQLAFAQAVQHSLLCAAPEVVLSWPQADGATELGPSTLLAAWPVVVREAPASGHWVSAVIAEGGARLEPLRLDAQAPAVQPGEHVRGGTGLLKAQAICPAWAYFQYRLGARALDQAVDGLDALERGNLVHELLCKLWGELQDHAALANRMSDAAVFAAFCRHLIDETLEEYSQTPGAERLGPRGRALEAARLLRLLQRWCALEVERSDGFKVMAREQKFPTSIQGIELSLIIDRIDRLEGGGLLIIDYKTGQTPSMKTWFEDRLTEPQLPLYATMVDTGLNEPVIGVALAAVQLRKPAFSGVASSSFLPGLTVVAGDESSRSQRFPDWDSVRQHWQDSLTTLAREVLDGDARLWVKDEALLRHCEVLPLLRLPEWREQARQYPGTGDPA